MKMKTQPGMATGTMIVLFNLLVIATRASFSFSHPRLANPYHTLLRFQKLLASGNNSLPFTKLIE